MPEGAALRLAADRYRKALNAMRYLMVLVLYWIGTLSWVQENQTHALVGQSAPLFEGKTYSGDNFKLADHIGQPMILYFLSVRNMNQVSAELPALERLQSEFEDLIIVSVTPEPKEILDQFLAPELGKYWLLKTKTDGTTISQPLLYGAGDTDQLYIDKTFPNWHQYEGSWPQKFFVDREGIVRSFALGYASDLVSPGWEAKAIRIIATKTDKEENYRFLRQEILNIVH